METQVQISVSPQTGTPASIIQQPGVTQRSGVKKSAVSFVG